MGSNNLSHLLRKLMQNGNTGLIMSNLCMRSLYCMNIVGAQKRKFCSITTNRDRPSKFNIIVIQSNLISRRFRKKKVESARGGSDDEQDEEDDELSIENPLLMDDIIGSVNDGRQVHVIEVGSLRLDAFSKVAFSMTRAKIEELFYKGDIYVNGEIPSKKSYDLSQGDEIDIVKQINHDDHTKMDIKRVQLVELPDKATEQGRMKVKINKWLELTVKAYDRRNI